VKDTDNPREGKEEARPFQGVQPFAEEQMRSNRDNKRRKVEKDNRPGRIGEEHSQVKTGKFKAEEGPYNHAVKEEGAAMEERLPDDKAISYAEGRGAAGADKGSKNWRQFCVSHLDCREVEPPQYGENEDGDETPCIDVVGLHGFRESCFINIHNCMSRKLNPLDMSVRTPRQPFQSGLFP